MHAARSRRVSADGVITDDVLLLRAEPSSSGRIVELSTDEVVGSYRAINRRELPLLVEKRAAAA